MIDLVGERTMRDLLAERAERRPDKDFLVFEDAEGGVRTYTYREFEEAVDALAAGLAALGIVHGDAVTVLLPNCPEILLTWFALGTLGAVMVPSNTANTAPELQHVLAFSGSRAVVTQPAFLPLVTQARAGAPDVELVVLARTAERPEGTVGFDALLATPPLAERPQVHSEDVVQMLFTSGTTARPKGVLLTHANALRAGERSSRSLYLDQDERCLTALPVFHVNAQSLTVLSALSVGGTCILLEEYRASKFLDQVRRHEATQTSVVAMQARTLLAREPRDDDAQHRLRRVFYAINITTAEKDEFERRFGVELINGYGLSEAMTLVAISPVFGPKRWPSLGLPTYDRQVRLVDLDGNDVAVGEVGEIVVSGIPGRTLMKGYHNDPEATAAALRDGWLYTGDNAYADEQGYLYWFDRLKDMIKRAGENVSTAEVESVLIQHPGVLEAAVFGVPDPVRDEAVKAVLVAKPGVELDTEQVRAFCAERLAGFKVPTIIEIREALPKTSIGKVAKGELRKEQA